MSVFENLIDELKQENLIEESVVESEEAGTPAEEPSSAEFSSQTETAPEMEAASAPGGDVFLSSAESVADSPLNENEFYRRRAIEEVSSLKMVERILSGVEREQLKIVPKSYDDIAVGKFLHDFLQVTKSVDNPESAAAEFKLMQETENWHSALSLRDKKILPVQLRRYCETTKPVLSPQALVALARFYRNSPFSESIRSKFDMVVTRLFARETDDEKRELAFDREELAQHFSELYADWASIPLYSVDDGDAKISETVEKFEALTAEAASAENFEELVKSDFFNRLRVFKEQAGEDFYAPSVAAVAVESNVRVGNIYVELLDRERRQNNAAALGDKYSQLLDQTVSEAAGKTLQLTNLLKERNISRNEPTEIRETEPVKNEKTVEIKKSEKNGEPAGKSLFKVNKWLLGATVLTILLTFALYSWVEFSAPAADSKEVVAFDLDGYYFKEYLRTAKVTHENLMGVVNPSWSDISDEKKRETMKNMLTIGREKGFRIVHLFDNQGKTVGYASADNINISNSN